MSGLNDLQTDRNKIIELSGVIERMEKDKSKIQDWVKAKEKEFNDFEERASKLRKDLEELKKKSDLSQAESDKKKLEIGKLQEKLNKDTEENRILKSEAERIDRDNASKFSVLEDKQRKFEELKKEVDAKIKRWNEIRESFLLIK